MAVLPIGFPPNIKYYVHIWSYFKDGKIIGAICFIIVALRFAESDFY